MPRVERKIEINAPREKVYEILDDANLGPKWNVAIKEFEEIEEGKYAVKSTVGDFTSIRLEGVENEKLTMKIEGGIFTEMGYNLRSVGDKTEVVLYGEFDDPKNEKMLTKAGELLLGALKRFAEFLEEGGDPDEFKK